jgi:hypothetical protein
VAGGTAPHVATAPLRAYGNSFVPVALYVMATGVVALTCIRFTRETKGSDL